MSLMLRYYVNYSDALYLTGRYAEAAAQALAGVEVAAELGLERSMGAMLAGNAAEPLIALGEWDRATRLIERSLELDPPAHHYAHLRLLLAWLRLWTGQLTAAEEILTDFRGLITGPQDAPQYAYQASCADAMLALASGDPERAWADAERLLDHWDLHHAAHHHPILWIAARAAMISGPAERAARSGRVRERFAMAEPVRNRKIWAPVIEAELADDLVGWRTAAAHVDSSEAPAHLRPYAGLRLGQHLVAGRERVEARDVLEPAIRQADDLGAKLIADPILALARRAGIELAGDGDRSGTSGPLATLTAREREVLRLVAAGRTNGEIGATLFISTKTASVHVSNILAKLGVSSRGEAAAVAHREALTDATDGGARLVALRPA
jgi:ATP/maltotriose-dependent transcriptional regulator MalT